MTFDSALFLFVAGAIVGGAAVYLLYTRIAVVAAELKAKVDAFEGAFGKLKADLGAAAGAAGTAGSERRRGAQDPAAALPAQPGATVVPPATIGSAPTAGT